MKKQSIVIPKSVVRFQNPPAPPRPNERKKPPQAEPIEEVLYQASRQASLSQIVRIGQEHPVASHTQHFTHEQLRLFDVVHNSEFRYNVKRVVGIRKFISVARYKPIFGNALAIGHFPQLLDGLDSGKTQSRSILHQKTKPTARSSPHVEYRFSPCTIDGTQQEIEGQLVLRAPAQFAIVTDCRLRVVLLLNFVGF